VWLDDGDDQFHTRRFLLVGSKSTLGSGEHSQGEAFVSADWSPGSIRQAW
jgi:hypothetical protein